DEFFMRTSAGTLRLAVGAHREMFPFLTATPFVSRAHDAVLVFHFAAHRQGEIRLAIENARSYCDGNFGDEFPDENNPAPPGVRGSFAHVKTQIHFFEIAMPRDRHSTHHGVIKEETNNADVGFPIVKVELGARRNMRDENFWIDGEIEDREIAPIRGQKRLQHITLYIRLA